MIETLSTEDRRHVRTSLVATLAVVFTFLLCPLAWAGVNPPAAEQAAPSTSAVPAAAESGSAVENNEMVGCGCAEGCLARP
jgi:hypothetical protein